MSNLSLQEQEILAAVRESGGVAETRAVADASDRFNYHTVRRVLLDLEARGYVANTSPRHGTAYKWEVTALAVSALSD